MGAQDKIAPRQTFREMRREGLGGTDAAMNSNRPGHDVSLSTIKDGYGTKGAPAPKPTPSDFVLRSRVILKIREAIGRTGNKDAQRTLQSLIQSVQEMK